MYLVHPSSSKAFRNRMSIRTVVFGPNHAVCLLSPRHSGHQTNMSRVKSHEFSTCRFVMRYYLLTVVEIESFFASKSALLLYDLGDTSWLGFSYSVNGSLQHCWPYESRDILICIVCFVSQHRKRLK